MSGTSMMDKKLNDVLKTCRAENDVLYKKLQYGVSSAKANMNGEFVEIDDEVNDKIKAAESTL